MNARDWKVYLDVRQRVRVDVRASDPESAWNEAERLLRDMKDEFGAIEVLEFRHVDCESVEEDV